MPLNYSKAITGSVFFQETKMSNSFQGKTAVISGGAGGIGLALAKELGRRGMRIVIGDIEKSQLLAAEQQLEELDIEVLACELDVTDFAQWQRLVEQATERFGKLHMLINNAGVGGIPGSIEKTDHKTWQWVVDVNLMGVVFGTQALTPALKSHGEGGWIINVASMAGMGGVPYSGAYSATKAAVVSLTEGWAVELKSHNIAVSVLCPAFVKTRIHESMRNIQDKYKNPALSAPDGKSGSGMFNAGALVEAGIDPTILANRVCEALESGQTYIFTHPNYRQAIQARSAAIDSAFKDAENSPVVKHLIGQPIDIL